MNEENKTPELYPLPFTDMEQLRLKIAAYQSKWKDLGFDINLLNEVTNAVTNMSHQLNRAVGFNKELNEKVKLLEKNLEVERIVYKNNEPFSPSKPGTKTSIKYKEDDVEHPDVSASKVDIPQLDKPLSGLGQSNND